MSGLTYRPLTLDDAPQIARLLNIRDKEMFGQSNWWELTVSENLEGVGFDLSQSSRAAVASDGSLVAFEVVYDHMNLLRANLWGHVDRAWRSQGIGSALIQWALDRAAINVAKAPADAQISLAGSVYRQDSAGKQLLVGHGFAHIRSFYTMRRDFAAPPVALPFPEGFRVVSFAENPDLRAFVEVDIEAFRQHWGYIPASLDEEVTRWQHVVDTAPDFDPNYWWIAYCGDMPAAAIMTMTESSVGENIAWVSSLGVLAQFRKRGLGSALLNLAMSAHFARGASGIALGVDASNATNAVAIYERAGMVVFNQRDIYEYILRAGVDYAPQ